MRGILGLGIMVHIISRVPLLVLSGENSIESFYLSMLSLVLKSSQSCSIVIIGYQECIFHVEYHLR